MNGEHIRDIPTSSRSKNIWIVLLKDMGNFALYLNKTDNCFGGFEIHRIRVKKSKDCDIKQKNGSIRHFTVPRRRIIAGSGEFGRFGWHYPTINLVFENHPEFKKYCDEIECKLKTELISAEKPISRVCIDKTSKIDSHSSEGVE